MPVLLTTDLACTISLDGEEAAKLLLFGGFAGSGKSFDATVTISNRDGTVVFAHNPKKENFQSAAENVAKTLKKEIEGR